MRAAARSTVLRSRARAQGENIPLHIDIPRQSREPPRKTKARRSLCLRPPGTTRTAYSEGPVVGLKAAREVTPPSRRRFSCSNFALRVTRRAQTHRSESKFEALHLPAILKMTRDEWS
ncbi:hypothetical protein C2E23DRAFT_903531 [Lenzites betulinus]|nr:hypothetical protein C2E23DRAFT_903531 [Lenzites betulinus]